MKKYICLRLSDFTHTLCPYDHRRKLLGKVRYRIISIKRVTVDLFIMNFIKSKLKEDNQNRICTGTKIATEEMDSEVCHRAGGTSESSTPPGTTRCDSR